MRAGNLFSSRGSAVLDAPEQGRAPKTMRAAGLKRSATVEEMPLRRDATYDYPDDDADVAPRQARGLRIGLRGGLIPTTLWGRIAAGCALIVVAGAAVVAMMETRSFLLHDARFTVPDEQAVEIAGRSHLTHAQLLSIFGEDVERNIFNVPLERRRAELEQLPWVEHATVMRLLPDHMRVAIVERTPVAFVRDGAHIGLADASGALFDMPSPEMVAAGGSAPHYSFPVVTGISAGDPLSTRAARMKIYMAFLSALDATGEKIANKISEVDVSDPEDVRAILPDADGTDVLIHFGDKDYLDRYHTYRQHLAEWRAQYPRLASADMRYDQQVVLGMKPDAPAANNAAQPSASPAPPVSVATVKPAAATQTTMTSPAPAAVVPHAATTPVPHAAPAINPTRPAAAKSAAAKGAAVRPAKRVKPQAKKHAVTHGKPVAAPTHAISEVAR